MLTPQEEDFIRYWSDQRLRKKQFLRKFSIGMPLGVLIAVALLINFLSGWYKKADMVLHSDTSVIFVVLIAMIGIVVFITIFSAHHKWDQNELYYNELLYKKEQESASDAAE
jgi:amino acid transporter